MEKLIKKLPEFDPFEGFSEGAVWSARFLARARKITGVGSRGGSHDEVIYRDLGIPKRRKR